MRYIYIILAVAVLSGVAYYLLPKDETLEQRQVEIRQRGSLVMPFDLDKTTHYFIQNDTGAVMEIKVKDPNDQEQVGLIREHLQKEANLFAQGDFGDPANLHGMDMPGLSVLSNSAGKFSVSYYEIKGGAKLEYISDDSEIITALHEWFMAQVMDHGSDAMAM